jgi:hypothetical protein
MQFNSARLKAYHIMVIYCIFILCIFCTCYLQVNRLEPSEAGASGGACFGVNYRCYRVLVDRAGHKLV